jgi:hypothetical protein
VAAAFSPEAFYESARDFAATALQAHHAREWRRVALDAGTALEHLAKACLANRSPALLSELRNEASFLDLLRLLGINVAVPEGRPLRTVGLRAALDRVKAFVTSRAAEGDLRTLVDMRDGTVHAAMADEVEERLVVAFAQHADALLADLGHDRAAFWGGQLGVVDALLADASDKIAHDVAVKIAAARAYFERRFANLPEESVAYVIAMEEAPDDLEGDELSADCPACESRGLAKGRREVDWTPDEWEGGKATHHSGMVFFWPSRFECDICHLRLESAAEIEAAGMERYWERDRENPREYEPSPDDDSLFYEAWREARDAAEE